jgi:hypothetical protein
MPIGRSLGRNIMKAVRRLVVAVLLALWVVPGMAAGPYDGAWSCTISVQGQTSQFVIALVTRSADNTTAWGIVATAPVIDAWGYGVGQIAGNVYAGVTNEGGTFRHTLATNSSTGTMQTMYNGALVTAPVNCLRIW